MIIEGELKDYIIIPIEDLVGLINEYKTLHSCEWNDDNKLICESKIELIDDLIEKYSK